ncbi:MAG: dihydroorotate dehydrogenase electron transfer subunit [Woeseiaceae bacterium]|nr:dihydroorotate dehydrogenase electron transfer subunit [Woeseiaceae bacterium]
MITAVQQHAQRNRGTIYVEDGEILGTEAFAGDQYVQRIRAPRCAAAARPGSFVHITCDPALPMRRPLSIMRAEDDWIEVLYKAFGGGLHLLADRADGDTVSLLGPIGVPFDPDPQRPGVLLIGGGVGIPPMVFLADRLRHDPRYSIHAILGSEIPFPFPLVPSKLPFAGTDTAVTSTMPLLESWGVSTRLTSLAGFDGCHAGYVTDLAAQWLSASSDRERASVKIFACGPTPMLKAVAELAARWKLPCEVSLEEFMACAVGGCAGCAVRIAAPDGPAMKRVCVAGPVFDAATVVW